MIYCLQKFHAHLTFLKCGLGGIQTPNLLIRSQMLYSVKLRARLILQSGKFKRINPIAKRSFWPLPLKVYFCDFKKIPCLIVL